MILLLQTARIYSLTKFLRLLFFVGIAVLLWATLTPASDAVQINDKIAHCLAFLMLAVAGLRAWPHSPVALVVGLLFLGAGIELVQALPFIHRDANLLDWIADAIGIGIAVCTEIVARPSDR